MACGLRWLGWLVGVLLALTGGAAAEVRVVGSDLLGEDFFRALYGFAAREKIAVATAFDGSRAGLESLRAGRAQLALVALPAEEAASQLTGFEAVPVAWHRVLVLVPAVLPLEQITYPQLAGILERDVAVSLNRWGDLGLAGEWEGVPITAHAPAAGTGLALEFFRRVVMNGGALKNFVGRYRTMEDLGFRLSGASRAIALAHMPLPKTVEVKALAVGVRTGTPAFAPTPDNVESGDYPLALPVRAVFSRARWSVVAPLVKFALSDESAAALEGAGLVPGLSSARERRLLLLEKRLRENLQK